MRLLTIGLLSMGCAETGQEQLSRLTRAWAVETAEASSASVTATTLMAALSAALCVQRADEDFLALQPGDTLPLDSALEGGLGAPVIRAFTSDTSLNLVISGVDVLDRQDQWLRITGTEDGTQFSVEIDALIDQDDGEIEVAKLVAFGQLRLDLYEDCSAEQSLVRGKALWIDQTDRRHDVQIPADAELGGDLSLGGDVPYLPKAGALGWSARIEGQERSITTEDAAEIRIDAPSDDVPSGRWPVVARGPGWSGTAFTELAP